MLYADVNMIFSDALLSSLGLCRLPVFFLAVIANNVLIFVVVRILLYCIVRDEEVFFHSGSAISLCINATLPAIW